MIILPLQLVATSVIFYWNCRLFVRGSFLLKNHGPRFTGKDKNASNWDKNTANASPLPRTVQENYDDQSVFGIPSYSTDFEYTVPHKATGFFPDSVNHVAEVDPQQETYTGMHQYENELFRTESDEPLRPIEGTRIVSGLLVDSKGGQHQAHGPTKLHPKKITPKCREYSDSAMLLEDWESPTNWKSVLEFGLTRLTPNSIAPVLSTTFLILREHECNAASVSTYVRFDGDAIGGIVFREKNHESFYAALLDTKRKVISLEMTENGEPRVISEAPVYYLTPSMRHNIQVNDYGENGRVEVLIDRLTVISRDVPFTDAGRFGIVLKHGNGLFDSFHLLP